MIEHKYSTPQHASHTPEERPTSTVQKRSYTEHRILRGASAISARHYAGTGPALVLMHGFPDNLHIYDRLIPYLHDRQVITFDFLGWGTSDKPTDYPYTSDRPVRIIFGADDPYLNSGVAEHFHEVFPTSELFLLPAGHWPQLDSPEEVARLLPGVPITTKP